MMKYLVTVLIFLGAFNSGHSSQLVQENDSEKNQSFQLNQPAIKDHNFLESIFERLKVKAKKEESQKQDFDLQKKRVWTDHKGNEIILE